MINVGITLFVIAACFYVGILYENVKILLCGVALIILLLLSLIEVFYRFFTMECHLEIPIAMAEQNKPVSMGIRVNNRGAFTSGKMKFRVFIHNAMVRKGKKNWIGIPHAYAANLRYDFPIEILESGCVEIELSEILIYSFTGMVSIRKKCKEYGSVIVLPKIHPLGIRISEPVRNFMGDTDVCDDVRPGHDTSELFDIRKYREKDKLQSIHWKLSAKTDELMVREGTLPVPCAIVVFLDVRSDKKQDSMSTFLELASSISYSLMDRKCAHFVAWYSKAKGEVVRVRVDDEERFYLFLSQYLWDGTFCDGVDVKERYKERFRGEYYMHDIVVNMNMELYINGDLVKKFGAKNIANECKKLEILL